MTHANNEPPSGINVEDTFRILLATDNHVGCLESDHIRGNDSFNTIEEILKVAVDRKVDFLLLGGDLFHDNKPSRKTLHRTLELFRQYTMGSRPVQFEVLSNQKENFPDRFGQVNYENENLNIGLPVFIIHGNHDDPAGDGSYSAIDLLSIAGYVNYFGKNDEVDKVTISPVLLQKGQTRIALYGLGNIRDERLNRTFQAGQVTWLRPAEGSGEWFNMFAVHQNRISHASATAKNYLPESFIPDFMHFVLWGHEHDSQPGLQFNSEQGFHVCQPGSSIAMTLSEGESLPKHITLLEINRKLMRYEDIPLRSVRPFLFHDLIFANESIAEHASEEAITQFLEQQVDTILAEYHGTIADDANPVLPIVRLRVDYSGAYTTINPLRFGMRFKDRVANPGELLFFTKKRRTNLTGVAHADSGRGADEERFEPEDNPELIEVLQMANNPNNNHIEVEELVHSILRGETNLKLEILPENEIIDAVREFVQKEEPHAIKRFVEHTLTESQRFVRQHRHDPTQSADDLLNMVVERKEELERAAAARRTTPSQHTPPPLSRDSDGQGAQEDQTVARAVGPRKRGQQRAKTTAKPPATRRKQATTPTTSPTPIGTSSHSEESADEWEGARARSVKGPSRRREEEEEELTTTPLTTRKRGRGKPVLEASSSSDSEVAVVEATPVQRPLRSTPHQPLLSPAFPTPSPSTRTRPASKHSKVEFGSDSSEEDTPPPPKKQPRPAAKATRGRPKASRKGPARREPKQSTLTLSQAGVGCSQPGGLGDLDYDLPRSHQSFAPKPLSTPRTYGKRKH